MANQVYGYGSSYGGSGLSNVYSSGLGGASAVDPSLLGSSRYDSLGSDPRGYDSLRFSGNGDVGGFGVSGGFGANMIAGGMGAAAVPSYWQPSWPGLDAFSAAALEASGVKRQAEALYHQTLLGTHNAIGQSEALFSSNSLAKRPRYESASSLPIYPQRPGEKDCAYYMRTRICRFGERCKFDHPLWVPEGGIPDWKETPFIETPPERPGEPDCPFFLKTQRCKFGPRCKFNHPKDKIENASAGGDGAEVTSETNGVSVLPERPSEVVCSFYLKTGKCKFGAACKFHHPKDIQISSVEQDPGSGEQNEPSSTKDGENATGDAKLAKTFVPITPALLHNYKGLPIRPGEVDCPFYLKTGSCKYGVACRYNHPDLNAIKPPVAGVFGTMLTSPAVNLPISGINAAAPIFPSIDPRFATSALGVDPTTYPQRPGQMECDFYMKTGKCKFGRMCKYHHPIDRSAPTAMLKQAAQQVVMLTRAGLPRREGVMICPFYMKTGTCSYGPACRFDHPPPGEVMAKATGQGSSGGEENVAAAEQ